MQRHPDLATAGSARVGPIDEFQGIKPAGGGDDRFHEFLPQSAKIIGFT